jgi:tetratricopeptide (TPR) repeat protein
MQTGLAEAWLSRVASQAAESGERLAAEANLALSLLDQGKFADAEPLLRLLHEVEMRVLGAEHPSTLTTANNLASSLGEQGKYTDAERIQREVLGAKRRVLGAEHPDTLITAGNLADSLRNQGKYAETEAVEREVLGVQKYVLGAEHLDTLKTTNNLAITLVRQGQYVEAEELLQAALASFQRVLGTEHPETLQTASTLEQLQAHIRAKSPTNAVAPATAGTAQPLPAGTRVLVARLVAKPEHNGKRARVVSFDARTGRYVVALDDGKELSVKADCVALPASVAEEQRGGVRG